MPRSHPGPGPPYRCTRSPAQHPHVLITQSPAFTSAVTPSDAQAAGLDKRVTTWGHHYSVIQSSVTALKIFCFLSFFLEYVLQITLATNKTFGFFQALPQIHREKEKSQSGMGRGLQPLSATVEGQSSNMWV